MKLKIYLALCLISGIGMKSFAQKPTAALAAQWDKILATAKKDNKVLLIDFYTSWCGPCKAMDQNVFPDPVVSKTLNEYYTVIKVDAEKEELGRLLAARYNVRQYPTFLWIEPNLRVLRKEVGYVNAGAFNDLLQSTAKNRKPVGVAYSQQKFLDYPEFYLALFDGNREPKKIEPAIVSDFLKKYKDLTDEMPWAILNSFPMSAAHRDYFLANYEYFRQKQGPSVKYIAGSYLFPHLKKAINDKDVDGFVAVLNRVPKYFDDAGEQQSVYLFNIPKEPEFYKMKVNFLDTCKYMTPKIRFEASMTFLMSNNLQPEVKEKVIGWLLKDPSIENTNDLSMLMTLALAHHYKGNTEKSKTFFAKGEKLAADSEQNMKFVNFYKKKIETNK